MRSLTTEQIILFFLIFGLPLLKSIATLFQKRSSPGTQPATREENEKELPRVQAPQQQPYKPVALVPMRTVDWPEGALPAVQRPIRQAPAVRVAPVPAVVPVVKPAQQQRRQVQKQAPAPKTTSPVVRRIPRDLAGQRRAIVLIAVFGPPRALDPHS